MAKKKKKKGRKQLTDQQPTDKWVYRPPFRSREVDPKLLKTIEGLDWHPKRCFIAYDWEAQAVCLIFPEPISGDSMWRLFEFEMNNSEGAHLLWGREIEAILKKAKKAGRRRRVL